jgi:hypothetical protein
VSHIPNFGDVTVSLVGDAASLSGDAMASPKFGICDTTQAKKIDMPEATVQVIQCAKTRFEFVILFQRKYYLS